MIQGINDYVMVRKLQRDEFIKQLRESETAKSTCGLVKEDEKTQSESFLLTGYKDAISQIFFIPSCDNVIDLFSMTIRELREKESNNQENTEVEDKN